MPDFSDLHLSTARLHLRPLAPADAPALFAIYSDPVVMRYWSSTPWRDRAQADASIERDRAAMREGTHLRLGLVRRADDALIGTVSLFAFVAAGRRAELGYALAREAWGSGHVQEGAGAVLAHAFDALALNRVEADADPRNVASLRSLERLGFVREGLLRERWVVAGEVSDTAFYGLLAADWRARAANLAATDRQRR